MTNYEVEKGVPVQDFKTQYPFLQMEVGDSFSAPLSERGKISVAAASMGKSRGLKFTVRKMDDSTIRIWRLK